MTAVTTIAGGLGPYEQTHKILRASASSVSAAADTSENTLATIAIPAGLMGANGILRITTLWSWTNSANNKTIKVYFGASGAGTGGTLYMSTIYTTTTGTRDQRQIANRNSASSQVGSANGFMTAAGWGTTTGAVVTSSVNTGNASEVVLTGQKASAGETITLESYLVELICVG